MTDYKSLLPYANEGVQTETLKACIKAGNNTKAAKLLGKNRRAVDKMINRIKLSAAKQGFAPEYGLDRPIPDGFKLKGFSDMRVNEDGKPIWYKVDADREQMGEGLKEFVDQLCESIKPAKPKPKPQGTHSKDLMSGIFIGDAHIGMKAWGQETRHSNFDTEIASEMLKTAIDDLVDKAPLSETGLLVDVGDFQHANSSHNTTFNGTPLDVDTRQGKTMRTSAEVMEYAIDRMLSKFSKVVVVVARGNHNPDVALAVQLILEFYYKHEPRVTVLPTDGFFHYIEWGKWLIGVNHGDKLKPQKLVSVMARDMAAAWGRATHRMWCLGHFHHQNELELDGCIVRKFGALTPPDSWHASMGFGSSQVMEMITFKKQGGKHSTYIYELEPPTQQPDITL